MAEQHTGMTYDRNAYIGRWKNFELYFTDPDPAMQAAWEEAEKVTRDKKKNLISHWLFRHGAKRFWMDACYTVTRENPVQLGGWEITAAGGSGVHIVWKDADGQVLADGIYALDTIVPEGLERKPNFLLRATMISRDSPFRYLLLMPPMPERTAEDEGGLLSHLHFQYAARREELLRGQRLRQPHWYATMCDADATTAQEVAIVRVLHGITE